MPAHQAIPRSSFHHSSLETTFHGVIHGISSPEVPILQYRGIKYAYIPARFCQSKLFTSYPVETDATKYGPICPQLKSSKTAEETLFGLDDADIPKQNLKQNELECLNLNITCPAGLSRLPVMVWIHGGSDRGSGSNWLYDGGRLVRHSMLLGKPIILVTFNFRIGLFGFAAASAIREDNKMMGDEGVGNYGLRDQRQALEWVHHFIGDFGGDPNNITLFGVGTGAADIVSHLLSSANEHRPLFQRAIIQSPILEPTMPDVASAGCHISRLMCALRLTTLGQLRCIEAEKLLHFGHTLRAVDDGVFFRPGWKRFFEGRLHFDQPIIVGDCSADSLLWSLPASHWTAQTVTRRVKAICQSVSKASALLNAYDISFDSSVYDRDDDEITERVLELINDTRVSWPTECLAQNARGAWRYVFDQEGHTTGVPHHAVDLAYLFDNIPQRQSPESFYDDDDDWAVPFVDDWTYTRVRDTMQQRWIAFANGEKPWAQDKVFVFGMEGETGERSWRIFESRRRKLLWKQVLEPLGMQVVQKIGVELSRGPALR
ncbi:Alpha/Beta hydrolase protein [Mycena floridula]|nr:Alpha/Beta hydrolase protein [Mycena floridula]